MAELRSERRYLNHVDKKLWIVPRCSGRLCSMVAQGGATGDLIYLRRNSRRRTPLNAMIMAMKAAIWGDWTLARSEEKRFGYSSFWSALLWAHHRFDSKKGITQRRIEGLHYKLRDKSDTRIFRLIGRGKYHEPITSTNG